MNNPNKVCKLCNKEILDLEPRFYFPKLPEWHVLSDIKGTVHTACLISEDQERKVGEQLANIFEGQARHSDSVTFVGRDGNIVARRREDEGRLEIIDLEDFCEFSIPLASIDRIRAARQNEIFDLGMQALRLDETNTLSVENKIPHFVSILEKLRKDRLTELFDLLPQRG